MHEHRNHNLQRCRCWCVCCPVALTHPLDTLTIHRQTNRRIQFTPTVLYRGGLPPALFQAAIIYGVGWVGCSARVDGQRAIGSAQELEADQLCSAPRSLCTLALSCRQYCWDVDARNSRKCVLFLDLRAVPPQTRRTSFPFRCCCRDNIYRSSVPTRCVPSSKSNRSTSKIYTAGDCAVLDSWNGSDGHLVYCVRKIKTPMK